MHSIEFSFQTPFCNLFEFPTTTYVLTKNSIILFTFSVSKLQSQLYEIELGEGFPIISRMPPSSNIVFNRGLSKNSVKNGSIINRFHAIAPNILNQVVAPLFIENF